MSYPNPYAPQGGYPQGGYPPAPGGYPSGPGYPTGQAYPPPAPGGYPHPPAPGGYPAGPYPPAPGGGYQAFPDPNASQGYPAYPQAGPGYPPQQTGGYPPQQPGGYPSQQPGGYPPQQPGAYPPQQPGGYPPQQPGTYPPQQSGGYPPQQPGAYPPQQSGGYPPQQPAGPPQQPGGYQPQQPGGYQPQQPGGPPQQPGGYAPQQPGGYQPQQPGGYAPQQPGAYPGGNPGVGVVQGIQYQGTIKPFPRFDAEEDCKVLRKAMKGIGTDEKAIVEVLAHRCNAQRQTIKQMFKQMFGKDLLHELKSELTSHFEGITLAMMLPPAEYDAIQIRDAIAGAGTKEGTLIEILCSRTNKQIADLKTEYKRLYGEDMEKSLVSDTSGHFRRLVVSLSTGGRMEGQPVNVEKARNDANELYQAGEKKLGTDESKFNQILCSQSYDQLRCVFDEYKKISKKGIEDSVRGEMSGDLEKGMLAIVSIVQNRPQYFAERLYHSMKGAGTKDDTLIRVIVSRSEIDLVQIKSEFQRLHGKTLQAMIEDDTSGDYKRMLLAIVNGN